MSHFYVFSNNFQLYFTFSFHCFDFRRNSNMDVHATFLIRLWWFYKCINVFSLLFTLVNKFRQTDFTKFCSKTITNILISETLLQMKKLYISSNQLLKLVYNQNQLPFSKLAPVTVQLVWRWPWEPPILWLNCVRKLKILLILFKNQDNHLQAA